MILSKKTKLFLGLGAGLMATTGIVTPLCCSCSNTDKNDIGGFDAKYGVNDAMVMRLEAQCEVNYRKTLEGKPRAEIEQKVAEMKKDVAEMRNQNKQKKYSNSIMSEALIDLMSSQYDTKIARDFDPSINFEDEIADFNKTCVNKITRKMNEEHIASKQIQTKIQSFKANFNIIRTELSSQYSDKLSILNNLKTQTLGLMDGINQELDQVAAEQRFKTLFSNYTFNVKKDAIDYWDSLIKIYKDGDDLTELVEKCFECVNNKTKTPIINFKLDGNERGGLMQGYIIKPICRGFKINLYKNFHSLVIEWIVIKDNNLEKYMRTKDVGTIYKTAASNAILKDKDKAKNLKSVEEIFKLDSKEKEFSEYELLVSEKYEVEQLSKLFENISFDWDRAGEDPAKGIFYPNCKYEGFFGANTVIGKDALLNAEQLADIGLCVKDKETGNIVRLQNLVENIKKNKEITNEEFEKLPALEKFARSVDIYSITNVVNDNTHEVTNTIYCAYKNSKYADVKNIFEKDHGEFAQVANVDCTGMPISKELYENSKTDFNQAYVCIQSVSDDEYFSYADKVKTCISICAGLATALGVLMVIVAVKLAFAIGDELDLVLLCGLIIAIPLLIGLAIAFRVVVISPTKHFRDQVNELRKNSDFINLAKRVNDDAEHVYKSYDLFKNLPYLGKVKPTVAFYKNKETQELVQKFNEIRIRLHTDGKEYHDKILSPFKGLFWTNVVFVGLVLLFIGVVFALKFTSLPFDVFTAGSTVELAGKVMIAIIGAVGLGLAINNIVALAGK